MAGITSTGIGSGLDVESLVSQLLQAEAKGPTQRLNRKEANLQAELSAIGSVKGALSDFQSSLDKLNDLASFQKRSASSSNSDLFTATATSDAAEGSYGVEVSKLAQAHKIASGAFTDSSTVVGTGELTFQF
ncbi:MAG TPA: flagellar cap protein FliD N-terminal domain-containing protein, partial [Gammaproteobacteria bacterium]|nr:flagellar cap protein FliD N-terminal domain-containing protein [Gammaproteobacteria bacterium]